MNYTPRKTLTIGPLELVEIDDDEVTPVTKPFRYFNARRLCTIYRQTVKTNRVELPISFTDV